MPAFRLSFAILASACILPAAPAAPPRHAYIVQLAATPQAPQADGDAARRAERQRAVLALVPDATVQYRYTTALHGFSALLSPAEVKRLRASPLVARVSPDTEEHVNDGGTHRGSGPAPQH
ncbi:protease inhibitor I9 family protein [Janthinobacterium sp. LB3P118]|uniref:protease inhibitor I9 family protein n=1 Tax=Janthinobacterium sp. LB3P118 TaxID=3424195 RepID=UPI003F2112E1